jgi:hypothetical protein
LNCKIEPQTIQNFVWQELPVAASACLESTQMYRVPLISRQLEEPKLLPECWGKETEADEGTILISFQLLDILSCMNKG